jgi:transcriptional antiterminator RfaH
MRRWYVVQTQPGRENAATAELDRQGYDIFHPRLRKTRRHARRVETVLAPLFPGYVFIHLDIAAERWRAVNGTRGVVRLVAFGERPASVPHGIIEALLADSDAGQILQRDPALQVGRRVRMLAGPFSDLVGTLDCLDARGRVRVLLELMGRETHVRLPASLIDA